MGAPVRGDREWSSFREGDHGREKTLPPVKKRKKKKDRGGKVERSL